MLAVQKRQTVPSDPDVYKRLPKWCQVVLELEEGTRGTSDRHGRKIYKQVRDQIIMDDDDCQYQSAKNQLPAPDQANRPNRTPLEQFVKEARYSTAMQQARYVSSATLAGGGSGAVFLVLGLMPGYEECSYVGVGAVCASALTGVVYSVLRRRGP